MVNLTVISGGQTGVDRAALDVAMEFSILHKGWCPPGRMAEGGPVPEKYNLKETHEEFSQHAPEVPRSLRSELNVRDSDGTLILTPGKKTLDPGTEWTIRSLEIFSKPFFVADPFVPEQINRLPKWLNENQIKILNIAGPSEKKYPGIYVAAVDFLRLLFQKY